MEQNLTQKIAAWTEGQLEDAALVEAIESAAEDATNHRNGFGAVVEDLNPEQQEHCEELISFAFQMLDSLDNELQEVLDGVETEDKPKVIQAGDMIARASFQLNQVFLEFRNQALAALGPTDIPNLNQLIAAKNKFVAQPDDDTRRHFQESIDAERVLAYDGVRALMKEPQLAEVTSLSDTFMSHLGNLNRLTEDLAKAGAEADYEAHFMALEMGFRELGDKVPAASVAIRAAGETEFPDLNYLLTMINEADIGNSGDGPLVEALQAVEMSFHQTYEKLQQGLTVMESALAKEEIEAALKAFDEDFKQGVESTYRFLTERETIRLSQAMGFFRDFATRLTQHKEKLKELEALEGKVTCPRCGDVNDNDRQRCQQCGFGLPQNLGKAQLSTFETKETGGLQSEPEEELLLTSNLVRLYEAVNAIHEQKIDDATFVAELDKLETLINASVSSLPEEPSTGEAEQKQAVTQVYDAFEEGVELMREGADLLRGYLDSRDEEALKEGVRTIDRGAKKVAAAGTAVTATPS